MKEFFGTLTTHVKRGIVSPMFFICTGLNTLLMFFFVSETYNMSSPANHGLNYFLDRIDHSGAIYFTMMITVFPAVMLFYEDWTSGFFKFVITKAGRKKYISGVLIASGLTAAAVMILSYTVVSLFVLTKYPLVPDMDADKLRITTFGFPNSGLIYTGHALLCYALFFLTQGARAAFFAVVAVIQSMIITNRHLTAVSPVLLYILYFSLNLYYITPNLANPYVLFWNGYKLYLIFGGTEDGSLFSPVAGIYPMLYCAVVVTLLSLIGSKILHVKMNKSI